MNDFCVYCHVSPVGKIYVGISTAPYKRWNSGKGYIKNHHFWNAIQKYGWDNFQHIILAEHLSAETAASYEINLINALKTTNPKFGYNKREGGDGGLLPETRALMSKTRKGRRGNIGFVMPETTKQKLSEALKDYYKVHPNPMLGKHHSPETIEKLKNRVFTPETRARMSAARPDTSGAKNPSAKAVRQLTKDGVLIKEYPYAKLAAMELNLDLSSIIKCCRHKIKSCGGFKWEYA